jgi:spore maturation protein SpmB
MKEGRGTPGMIESVTVAVKKGTSASGKDTLTLKVLESFGVNSKRARCLDISMGVISETRMREKTG